MKFYLVLWLSGLLVGMILVERWRRNGDLHAPVDPGVPDGVSGPLDASAASTGSSAPAKRPNVVGLVVTGAKLDAERVKQRVTKAKRPDASVGSTSGAQ